MKFFRALGFWLFMWVGCTALFIGLRSIYETVTNVLIVPHREYADEPAHSDPFPEQEESIAEAYDTYCWDMKKLDWEIHCQKALYDLGPPPPEYISGRAPAWALVSPSTQPVPSAVKTYAEFKRGYNHEPDDTGRAYETTFGTRN